MISFSVCLYSTRENLSITPMSINYRGHKSNAIRVLIEQLNIDEKKKVIAVERLVVSTIILVCSGSSDVPL